MATYGIATIFEDHPVGHEFTTDNLPLHLTHVDSFEIGLSADELAAKLGELLVEQRAFSVKAVADEAYGPEHDIPVTTLELTPELAALQTTLLTVLQNEGAVLKNPHFHGDNFAPHISMYGTRRVTLDSEVLIRDITIAAKVSEAEDANRRVLANITFARD